MPIRHAMEGVTLIELLVVVTLIGLMSTMAAPSLTAYLQRARVRGALMQLSGELYQARVFAVRQGTRVQLRFQPRSGCAAAYELVRMDRNEVVRRVEVDDGAHGVCLSSNVRRSFSIDARGLIMGSARTVSARAGAQKDSLVISLVGRVLRSE